MIRRGDQNHVVGVKTHVVQVMMVEQFAVGAELPSSPLVALTTMMLADSQEPELIVASEGEGLLAFNGRNFRRFYAQDSAARAFHSMWRYSANLRNLYETPMLSAKNDPGAKLGGVDLTRTRFLVLAAAGPID